MKKKSGSFGNIMKMIFILLIVQNLLIYRETAGLELNYFIDPCDAKDPQLKKCVTEAAQKLIPTLANGISEWKVSPLDPLTAPSASFKNTDGDDYLEIQYKNIVDTGFSTAVIEAEEIDLARGIMAFKVNYPSVIFLADYTSKGRMLNFDIEGQGRANSTALNVHNDLVINFHVEADHIKMDSMNFSLTHDKIYLDFPNLIINGDKELSKSAKSIIAENGDAIMAQFKPQTEKFYADIISKEIQNLFDHVPYSVLFKNA